MAPRWRSIRLLYIILVLVALRSATPDFTNDYLDPLLGDETAAEYDEHMIDPASPDATRRSSMLNPSHVMIIINPFPAPRPSVIVRAIAPSRAPTLAPSLEAAAIAVRSRATAAPTLSPTASPSFWPSSSPSQHPTDVPVMPIIAISRSQRRTPSPTALPLSELCLLLPYHPLCARVCARDCVALSV
jgi:hypothetical protein